MALFESYERRIGQITPFLELFGIRSCQDAQEVCKEKGLDIYKLVKEIVTVHGV